MGNGFRGSDDIFDFLGYFTDLERTGGYSEETYRLDRMRELTNLTGNPEQACRTLHVAGSKGKGSTASYLAYGLKNLGYKVGLYLSPHVSNWRERITTPGGEIHPDILDQEMETILDRIDYADLDGGDSRCDYTFFELLTTLALCVFRRLRCEWVVLEVGIGGLLDATNVVTPEAAFITSIELEHTEILGKTISEVTNNKCGIIKPNIPTFAGLLENEAAQTVSRNCRMVGSPIHFLKDQTVDRVFETTPLGEHVKVRWRDGGSTEWQLPLPGRPQGENSILAAMGLRLLNLAPTPHMERLMLDGFADSYLPGRMERVQFDGVPVVLDGAHTPLSLKSVTETFFTLYGCAGILIFGTTRGRAIPPLARELVSNFRHILICRAGEYKPESPELIFSAFKEATFELKESGEQPGSIELLPSPVEALERCIQLSQGSMPVLVTGSFHLAGEIRNHIIGAGRISHILELQEI